MEYVELSFFYHQYWYDQQNYRFYGKLVQLKLKDGNILILYFHFLLDDILFLPSFFFYSPRILLGSSVGHQAIKAVNPQAFYSES